MKRMRSFYSSLVLSFALANWGPLLLAQEPILETYSISHGGNQATKPSEVEAELFDKSFGGGTAKAQIRFMAGHTPGSLLLQVFRTVSPGRSTFALLVPRIEVRGYDFAGVQVYARDVEGFVFGDSQSG